MVGKKELEFEFKGSTIDDLVEGICVQYGKTARRIFFLRGDFDPSIKILVNGRRWITHDKHQEKLADGDSVAFVLFVSGG